MLRRRMPFYNPRTDPNLFLDWDASDALSLTDASDNPVTDNTAVQRWHNRGTGGGYLAVTTGTAPIYRATDKSLDFSGSTSRQLVAQNVPKSIKGLSGCTVAIVLTPNQSSTEQAMLSVSHAGTAGRIHTQLNTTGLMLAGGTRLNSNSWQDIRTPVGTAVATQPIIFVAIYNYASARLSLYVNGIPVTSGVFQTPGLLDSSDHTSITLGNSAQGTQYYFRSKFHDVKLWLKALTPQELVAPHHYLRRKWRIEPVQGGLFMAPPPSDPPPSGGSSSMLFGPDGEPLSLEDGGEDHIGT